MTMSNAELGQRRPSLHQRNRSSPNAARLPLFSGVGQRLWAQCNQAVTTGAQGVMQIPHELMQPNTKSVSGRSGLLRRGFILGLTWPSFTAQPGQAGRRRGLESAVPILAPRAPASMDSSRPPLHRWRAAGCRAGSILLARRGALTACIALLASPLWAADALPAEPAYLHTTAAGDTLIGLSRRFLADPAGWPELARANRVANPNRIPTGTVLRIPLRLMVTESAPAVVTAVSGEVRSAGDAAVTAGQSLPEGAELRTGDGNVTLRLVDGTVLRLRAASRLQIDESQRVPRAGMVRSGVRLQQGQVEVQAKPAAAGQPGFRVGTPQGVLGVRGTEFRVSAENGAGSTRGEVLEGAVAADGAASSPRQLVKAGFGVVVDRTGSVALPVPLLPAPDLSQLPALQERPLVRFTLVALSAAAAYRGQVSRDASFEQLVADTRSASTELRIADLPDGEYVLRVRGEDLSGLQGLNAEHRFRLKARPEPPLPSAPAPRAIFSGDRVEFAWTVNPDARSYRLQLSRSEDFSTPQRDLLGQTERTLALAGLAPGVYFWRLASERSATDQGPYGAVHRFELRPLPPPPKPPQVGEQSIQLAWEGLPGQTFEVQFARDATFTALILERKVAAPSLEIDLPGSGRFFVRLRARDPDGFVGPFTTPQQFDIPNCLRDGSGACVKASGQSTLIAP